MPSRSSHVATNGNMLVFHAWVIFLCVCVCVCVCVCTYHISIHSSVHGYWGCFRILATVNNAAINTGVHIYFLIRDFIFFRKLPRSKTVGSYGSSVFSFQRNFRTVLHSGCYQFTFLPTVKEGSLFSTPSLAFIVCRFFDDGYSGWPEVIHYCSFDLYFSDNEWFFKKLF